MLFMKIYFSISMGRPLRNELSLGDSTTLALPTLLARVIWGGFFIGLIYTTF